MLDFLRRMKARIARPFSRIARKRIAADKRRVERLVKPAKPAPKGPATWRMEGTGLPDVAANTKSEARARFKQRLNLKRLPPGTIVSRVSQPSNETP